jgi:hypothetical protein
MPLMSYRPNHFITSDTLTVFIEGDGLAWIAPSLPSDDPTPANPLALRLALKHQDGNAAYLGRPCQYIGVEPAKCPSSFWLGARFSPAVVEATSLAIDQLKHQAGARQIVLVGYSGGGAVAALVAVRRNDVKKIITVAGNMDHETWSREHRVTPLSESLNPIREIALLSHIPQWHFVGSRDRNVTPDMLTRFVLEFPVSNRPTLEILENFDHECCWEQAWQEIWQRVH